MCLRVGRDATGADATEETGLVLPAGWSGLPDPDGHSGVFLAQVATGSHSIVEPTRAVIRLPRDAARLRVKVFDGNNAGLWDQNQRHGPAEDSIVRYEVRAMRGLDDLPDADGAPPPLAVGESEALPGAQSPDATVVYRNVVDGVWEDLVAARDPLAAGDPVQPDGSRLYGVTVRFQKEGTNRFPAIDGYKIAAGEGAEVFLVPFRADGAGRVLAGFVGGLVDSRDYNDFALPAVSRDHYPDVLRAQGFQPASPWPNDAYENRYAGTIEVPLWLAPEPGERWAEFLARLILSEGDADDATDESGVDEGGAPQGPLQSRPGIPPDDALAAGLENEGHAGGFRIPRFVGIERRNNLHYRMPGRPRLEVVAPDGSIAAWQEDLSGTAGQLAGLEDFERVLVPADLERPGLWRLRFRNVDARNTVFVRAGLSPYVPPPCTVRAVGRVVCDAGCDGALEPGDTGIEGVSVLVRRLPDGEPRVVVTDPFGAWTPGEVSAGETWEFTVDPDQPALSGRSRTTPGSDTTTVTYECPPGEREAVVAAEFGYCCPDTRGVTISGRVVCDLGCDGISEPEDVGIEGVTVTIVRVADGDEDEAVTAEDGSWSRAYDSAGEYEVSVDPDQPALAGRSRTFPGSDTQTVSPGPGATVAVDFGTCCETPPVRLSGRVVCDAGCDSALGEGDSPIGGVSVRVRLLGDDFEETVVTGADGTWSAAYPAPGDYEAYVDPDQPALSGRARTTPASDAVVATLEPGAAADLRYGYCCAPPPCPVELAGRVSCDEGCDGQVESWDEPMEDVLVRIRRPADGFEETVRTGTDGTWSRSYDEAGTYEVFVDPAQPAVLGRARTAPSSDAVTLSLAPGESANVDFGFCCEPPCACAPNGKVHRVALETRLWVGGRRDFRLRIAWRKGCGPCGPYADVLESSWTGERSPDAGATGRSGLLDLVAAFVDQGELVVRFRATAAAPAHPAGWFAGKQRFEVSVETDCGCDSVAACGHLRCRDLEVGHSWPSARPCGCCAPPFTVLGYVPLACSGAKAPKPGPTKKSGGHKKPLVVYQVQVQVQVPAPFLAAESRSRRGRDSSR